MLVEVRDLCFTYPARRGAAARTALDHVSFEVARREIFGLLGPNGGGKTTLFGVLSTLLAPSSGRAAIDGIDAGAEPDAVRRRLGVAFQSPSLDKKLTVAENLRHQGRLYGLRGPGLERRIAALLGSVGLEDRRRERVETLSGGMARRVEIAKALLHAPPLLLLDEPSTGLDPAARKDVWDYLERVRREDGTTVLLTTHLMDEAARCDRLALLDRGRIVALGTPDRLTSEIGGDVVTVQSADPEPLAAEIRERFDCPVAVLDGSVRIECAAGHRLIPQVVEAFPGRIRSIALSKPTLEDVFIHRTGRRLGEERP
jgi:ABC-2 type transport system ATP-binding protein